ncbi:unnamed protein product [Rangifer tarandus platyrhynchus]|uniref:Uncharacterized protein n=2 Tax=Rangifer tarandus platyrhynchus TaxID=3082113 RepID=A0AC60A8R2_RANTA|nr:unnamed protein product [Rangifer tarandus platyrhynchus]
MSWANILGWEPRNVCVGQCLGTSQCCLSVVQSLRLFATPMGCTMPDLPVLQYSRTLLKFMSIKSVMLTISPSAARFSFCLQSFPASRWPLVIKSPFTKPSSPLLPLRKLFPLLSLGCVMALNPHPWPAVGWCLHRHLTGKQPEAGGAGGISSQLVSCWLWSPSLLATTCRGHGVGDKAECVREEQ